MNASLLIAAAVAIAVCGVGHARAQCLKYEPAIVTLEGALVKRTFPGPPNYESVPAGDQAEEALLLVLTKPLCVDEDPSSELNSESESDLLEVQIVPHDDLHAKLFHLVGQRVSVVGNLFHSHTGHHRTRVLIWPTRVEPEADAR